MTTNQSLFALAGLIVTIALATVGFLKFYIDAKIDPIALDVKTLVNYMMQHAERIATLEEKTKNLK